MDPSLSISETSRPRVQMKRSGRSKRKQRGEQKRAQLSQHSDKTPNEQ